MLKLHLVFISVLDKSGGLVTIATTPMKHCSIYRTYLEFSVISHQKSQILLRYPPPYFDFVEHTNK